ncbi:MAG: hypothetical protein GY910_00255 [bacterium]|nr:hypothetical protein [bacterium]
MRATSHRIIFMSLITLATIGVFLVAPAAVIAQSGDPAGEGDPADSRWIPSVSLQTGIAVNKREGEVSSIERGYNEGRTTQIFGTFGSSLQLETPRLSFIPYHPRFFARADIHYGADNKESLVSEGIADDSIRRLGNGFNLNGGVVEQVVGRGSALRPQVEPLILGGGLGLSFQAEVLGRKLRIKPSVEWIFQRDEIALEFSDVEGNGTDPGRCQPECRAVSINAQDTKGYHSLGPGLELDYDTGRAGNFRASLFSRFQALAIVSGRDSRLDATGSWLMRTVERINGEHVITSIDPVPGRGDTTVSSRYKRDPWSYVVVVGFRLYWDPR